MEQENGEVRKKDSNALFWIFISIIITQIFDVTFNDIFSRPVKPFQYIISLALLLAYLLIARKFRKQYISNEVNWFRFVPITFFFAILIIITFDLKDDNYIKWSFPILSILFFIDVFWISKNSKTNRENTKKKSLFGLILSLFLNVLFLSIYFNKNTLSDNHEKLQEKLIKCEKMKEFLVAKIDSLESLPPTIVLIPENNKKGGFYITFLTNDSISGHYISPQGITYILQGVRKKDSLYQGVIININNITEENHFHFHINSDNQINGNFVVGKDTIQIKENVIVNDSQEPPIEESNPSKTEKEEVKPEETKLEENEIKNKEGKRKAVKTREDNWLPPPRPDSIKVGDIKYIYLGSIKNNIWTSCSLKEICQKNEKFDINRILNRLVGSPTKTFRLYYGKNSSLKSAYVSFDIELEAASSKIDTVYNGRNSYSCWMKMRITK